MKHWTKEEEHELNHVAGVRGVPAAVREIAIWTGRTEQAVRDKLRQLRPDLFRHYGARQKGGTPK